MKIHARLLRHEQGWARNCRVTCADGRIARLEPDTPVASGDCPVDLLLPAIGNLHSHSFQRAMAGMTEFRADGRESFWTWRNLMYRFVEQLTPDHIEAIAALAFMEMMEAGFAAVGEFHYLHHRPGGAPYARLPELSDRIFAAAAETGIGLTHLPVLYSYGGVHREVLAGGQQRFSNDVAQYLTLLESCRDALSELPADTRIGIAPHSLRATVPADLARLLDAAPRGPIHIHIAEQQREVSEVERALGARPVEWLLENAEVGEDWCLIHATHMTEPETAGVAKSGAVVGLCPITEANLGDGIFNGPAYLAHGGAFGIGSDSNIRISPKEELRMLEYSQRLRDMARNVMMTGTGSVGRALYIGAAAGGARALGRDSGRIETGRLADLVAVDRSHPSLCALNEDQLLDGLCFAAPDSVVTDTWSAGRHMVKSGRHVAHEAIVSRYRAAMRDLLQRL